MDLTIENKLTIYDVAELRKKILSLQDTNEQIRMDLSQVSECDTAGIQFICAILRSVQEKKRTIVINKFSQAIHDAAEQIGLRLATNE